MALDDLAAGQQALNAALDRQRRTSLGAPLALGDADLSVLATPDAADLPSARSLWMLANPGLLGGLLDAEDATT